MDVISSMVHNASLKMEAIDISVTSHWTNRKSHFVGTKLVFFVLERVDLDSEIITFELMECLCRGENKDIQFVLILNGVETTDLPGLEWMTYVDFKDIVGLESLLKG